MVGKIVDDPSNKDDILIQIKVKSNVIIKQWKDNTNYLCNTINPNENSNNHIWQGFNGVYAGIGFLK
jgi:hypothetical protein